MCIGIIWNNSFLVGGRARAEARIDPRPLRTLRSTAHGAQVVWPLDYMGSTELAITQFCAQAVGDGWCKGSFYKTSPLFVFECYIQEHVYWLQIRLRMMKWTQVTGTVRKGRCECNSAVTASIRNERQNFCWVLNESYWKGILSKTERQCI